MRSVYTPVFTAITLALAAQMANAGSFSLYTEGNSSAVGNFGAGIAAEAADASIGWYNPAGLTRIQQPQATFGATEIFPYSALTGTSTYRTVGAPPYIQSFNKLDSAQNAAVPSFHYALPLGPEATLGFSAVAPFGLSTKWDRTSALRYAATFTQLQTYNFSPELGIKINPNWSVGAGLDVQYARVQFDQVLGVPALFARGLPASFLDSYSHNKGHSTGAGFHAGILTVFNNDHSRVGLNYQSQVRHDFHGYSKLQGPLASPGLSLANPISILTADSQAVYYVPHLYSNTIKLPDIVTLSGYHDLNDKLALLSSIVYTGWHSFKRIELNNVAAYTPGIGNVPVNSIALENYRDTWRAALGLNYCYNQQWMLRVGGGYDQTPTINSQRDIRLADASRWASAIGAHYQWRNNLGIDVGYTHLFTNNTTVNKTQPFGTTSSVTVDARGKPHVDLVGAQITWLMDAPKVAITK